MASFRDLFPSKFLKASDLPGPTDVTITSAGVETLGSGPNADTRIVIGFRELDKRLVLNRTNCTTLAEIADSEDWETWPGTRIRLVTVRVDFQGRRVDAIRIERIPGRPPRPRSTKPPVGPEPGVDELSDAMADDEEIPF